MSNKTEAAALGNGQAAAAMMPPVDVMEDASGITLIADLPGVPKEKLTVRTDADQLLIEGEVALEVPEGMESVYAELQAPRYRRAFVLSRELDTSRTEAAFKDGVLKLRIPKAEHARPRKLEVKVG